MSGIGSPSAGVPRTRIRSPADFVQLGNRGCARPRPARDAGRGRPQHVRDETDAGQGPGTSARAGAGALIVGARTSCVRHFGLLYWFFTAMVV